MKKQVYNPYLPLNEYVPDGEPHVFGDRLYIYGSQDEAGGSLYCPGHYVTWSAPLDDLSDWRCEGVIYKRGLRRYIFYLTASKRQNQHNNYKQWL